MSRLYRQPVIVQADSEGNPIAFAWQGRTYPVINCNILKAMPSRFRKAQEPDRYRCETKQGLVCDLLKKDGHWVLERVWD